MYNIELYNEVIRENTDDENEYCDYEKCAACGKDNNQITCCVVSSCELDASDFEVTYENVMKLLDSGYVVMDKIVSPCKIITPEEVWFLRMRGEEDGDYKVWNGGSKCALLTENGCPIPFKKRAFHGRRAKCWDRSYNSRLASCRSFLPYQDILLQVLNDLPINEVQICSII